MLAPSLGRPQLRSGREGFPQVQILENRSASAKPLRETPPPLDQLPKIRGKAARCSLIHEGDLCQCNWSREPVALVCFVYLVYSVCLVCSVYSVRLVWTRHGNVRSWGPDFRGIRPPRDAWPPPLSPSQEDPRNGLPLATHRPWVADGAGEGTEGLPWVTGVI